MKLHYENLEVWQDSVELYQKALPLLAKLPIEEKFGLAGQARNALLSVALNIAEGSGRGSKPDFRRFVRQAFGSLIESDAAFKVAVKVGYLSRKDYTSVEQLIERVFFKLVGLDKALRIDSNKSAFGGRSNDPNER